LQLAKLEEVYGLKKYVPQLTYLDLSDNPLSEDKSYRYAPSCCSLQINSGSVAREKLIPATNGPTKS
jgi:hypothetical protein